MTVRHLNCASMRRRLATARRRWSRTACWSSARPGCCWSTPASAPATAPTRSGSASRSARVVRPVLDPAETALAQVRALGYDAADVTDIALTHLDLDHVGGIGDFPHARVHVFADELDAALHPTLREKARYLEVQRAHGPDWVRHDVPGDAWFGFGSVTALGRRRAPHPAPGPHPRPLRRRRPAYRRQLAAARR